MFALWQGKLAKYSLRVQLMILSRSLQITVTGRLSEAFEKAFLIRLLIALGPVSTIKAKDQ